jgi:hypothetical protein
VQRRASNTGVIMVVGQKIALGRIHKHQTVTVLVSDITLAIQFGDGDVRVIRRTTTTPVRSIKGQRPAGRCSHFLDHVSHICCRITNTVQQGRKAGRQEGWGNWATRSDEPDSLCG